MTPLDSQAGFQIGWGVDMKHCFYGKPRFHLFKGFSLNRSHEKPPSEGKGIIKEKIMLLWFPIFTQKLSYLFMHPNAQRPGAISTFSNKERSLLWDRSQEPIFHNSELEIPTSKPPPFPLIRTGIIVPMITPGKPTVHPYLPSFPLFISL